uniref:Uncharacterized protein n=1 Tax=Bursaphelenchus xylophilus TaxID=6326 RepID=A0A1I7SEW5_BURXY
MRGRNRCWVAIDAGSQSMEFSEKWESRATDLQKLVLHLRVPHADKAFVFKNFVFLSPTSYIDLTELAPKHEIVYTRRPSAADIGAYGLIKSYLSASPDPLLTTETTDAMGKECFTGNFYCVIDQTTGELKGSFNQIYYSGNEVSIFQWNEIYGGQYVIDHVTGHCFRINRKMRTFRGNEPLTSRNDSFPEILTKYPFVMSEDVFLTRRFMLIDEEIDQMEGEDEYPIVPETTAVVTTTEETTTTTVTTTREAMTSTATPHWHDHQVEDGYDTRQGDNWNYGEYNYDRPMEDKVISNTPKITVSTARLRVFHVKSSSCTHFPSIPVVFYPFLLLLTYQLQ